MISTTVRYIATLRKRPYVILLVLSFLPITTRAQAQTGGPFSLAGKAINAVTGSPLSRATVSLELAKDGTLFASVLTDENGAFQFLHLPADRYILRGSHRGYLTTAYDAHDNFTTALVTGDGQDCCTNLQLHLVPGGVIAGTVMEDSGDPVARGQVALYRETSPSGDGRIRRVHQANVDEAGRYEFTGLEPGSYFLSAIGQPWYSLLARLVGFQSHDSDANRSDNDHDTHSPLDVVYATTFYPDTTDENAAAPIPIKSCEHIRINFALHPTRGVHITVRMPQSGREGIFFVPQIEHRVFGTPESLFGMPFVDQEGAMEISVPPGQYEFRMPERDGIPSRVVSVDATADETVDMKTGSPLTDVTGKVALSSGEALPENTSVSLITVEGRGNGSATLQKDNSFTIRNVPPGVYELSVSGAGKHFHASKLIASGAQVSHRQITIGSGSVTLAATLNEDPGLVVSGFAKKDGKVIAGVMIVLVPNNPLADREDFRRAQSDSDGNFVVKNVEPGLYTVVAIQDGWALDWAQPDVIRHYLQQGQSVRVTEQSPQTTQLREPVAVQPK